MKYLFAWELGANMGHILRQRLLLRELHIRGHMVAFYLKDDENSASAFANGGFKIHRSPGLNANLRPVHRPLSSYGDILASKGIGRRDVIEPIIREWLAIFVREQPDAVLLDHSPVALIAARLANIPAFNIGTGFEIPPDIAPYPCFRPQVSSTSPALLLQTESHLVATLNALAAEHGANQHDQLAAFMRADGEALLTFPEFDHYPQRTTGNYVGPLFDIEHGTETVWPVTGLDRNVFVYVRPDSGITILLDSLKALDANVICCIPGLRDEHVRQYASERFQIHTSAIRLDRLLPDCDLVVSHAAHGLLSACVCFGIPILGIPTQMEQYMLSRRIVEVGNGLALSRREYKARLNVSLDALLGDAQYRTKAHELAEKYGTHDRQQVVSALADEAERLVR